MASKKISHHVFVNGSPVCGNKAKDLVAATSASPVANLCGRCLMVLKARDPAKHKSLLEGIKAATEAKAAPVAPVVVLAPVVKLEAVKAEKKAAPARKAKAPQTLATKLLNPTFAYTETGKIRSITGTCPECKTNTRTISAADAFQVCRCVACQKKAVNQRIAAARKAKRAAKRAAREAAKVAKK